MARAARGSGELIGQLLASFIVGAVAGAVAGAARVRTAGSSQLVDWDRADQVATLLAGEGLSGRLTVTERREREEHYQAIVNRVSPHMSQYLGDSFAFGTKPEVLDRADWIRANIGSFGVVFEPVEAVLRERLGNRLVGPLNQQTGSIALGIMLGYLSRRVLGQYDPALLGKEAVTTGRLYFVEPNLEAARRQLQVPKEQFETWIVFHELTHSWQFEAHPWLRQFMNERVKDLLTSAGGRLARLDGGELLRLIMRGELDVRQPQRVLMSMMTAEQRAIFDGLQGLMSLLEGFSNHVMDALGPGLLADYDLIAAQFEHRQEQKSPAEKLFIRLTGLEMKMEQYKLGERFVNHIVGERGIAVMNRVWQGPETLPSLREIYEPGLWLERLG